MLGRVTLGYPEEVVGAGVEILGTQVKDVATNRRVIRNRLPGFEFPASWSDTFVRDPSAFTRSSRMAVKSMPEDDTLFPLASRS